MKRKAISILAILLISILLVFRNAVFHTFEYVLVAIVVKNITCDTQFPTYEVEMTATLEQIKLVLDSLADYADKNKFKHALSDVKKRTGIEKFLQIYDESQPKLNVFIRDSQIKIMMYTLNIKELSDIESILRQDSGSSPNS